MQKPYIDIIPSPCMPELTFHTQMLCALFIDIIAVIWGLTMNLILSTIIGLGCLIGTVGINLYEYFHPYPPTLLAPNPELAGWATTP